MRCIGIVDKRSIIMMKLRPYEKGDAESVLSWIDDEASFRKWSADRYSDYPITAEDMNEYYAENSNHFVFTALDDNKLAGHMIMRYIDESKRIIRFGFIIVDSKKRGKGYGKQMLTIALKYVFEELKVNKVTIGVFENNPAAVHCYTSLGFQHMEEKDESIDIMGEKWKCLEMELSREDYEQK